jgi:hypothetical protein
MPDTRYAREIAKASTYDPAGSGEESRIERIFVKAKAVEEIRFSWWTNGNFRARPLDLPLPELVLLIARGMKSIDGQPSVLPPDFLEQVRKALPTA